jgi:ATP-binding cassette subfamily C exporter for protease/lipase
MPDSDDLKSFIARVKPIFFVAAAFSMVVNLLMLVPSLYMLQVYDRVLTSRSLDTLLMLTLLAAGLYGLLAFSEWVRAQLLINTGIELDASISPRVFESFVGASTGARGPSAVVAFSDASQVRQFLTGTGLFALFDAPWTPIYLVVIYLIHPWLAYVSIFGALLLLLLAWFGERITHAPLKTANNMAGSVHQMLQGFGRNHESIVAMGMLQSLRQLWMTRQQDMVGAQALASRRAAAIAASSRLIRMLQQMAILGLGAMLVIRGEITPGAMIAASILMGRALAPLDQAIASVRLFTTAREAYRRLGDLLRQHPAPPPRLELPVPQGHIAIHNLTLVPPGAQSPVLTNIDFQIRTGMAVGVVGPSGSGKSCLARALMAIWQPVRGEVRIDGAVIANWDRQRLGPHLGYLPQTIELFDGTVAQNIARFGEQSPDLIVAAAKSAGIHELVLNLPQGYETLIGPDGTALSGGQRQRVALARAIYGNPRFVVLDEPNSNLDDQGEAALMQVLAELRQRGATVVIITHRRAILSATEGLVVLKDGRLQVYGPTPHVLQQLAGDGPPVNPTVPA